MEEQEWNLKESPYETISKFYHHSLKEEDIQEERVTWDRWDIKVNLNVIVNG